MRGHEGDGEPRAREQHGEVFHCATDGEEFRLARKLKSDLIHARLVNRPGNNGIDLSRDGESGRLFERGMGGACAGRGGFA